MKKRFYFISLLWGAIWAAFLQLNQFGRFLAQRRTWLTVVGGVGGDLIILLFAIPFQAWIRVFLVIALSSVGIIYRSLNNELGETLEEIDVIKGRAD